MTAQFELSSLHGGVTSSTKLPRAFPEESVGQLPSLPAMMVVIAEQDLYLIAKNCQSTLAASKTINKEGKQWDKSVHLLCMHI